MADYAGAKAAIKARLDANWSTTRITYQNEPPADPWPPVTGGGDLTAWANLEIIGTGSEIYGQGSPGNQTWLYTGLIHVHVFVPVNSGIELADQYAVAIGEIFRGAKFYDGVSPGCYVRTWSPQVGGGGSGSDDGAWWRETMTVDFEYWHRG